MRLPGLLIFALGLNSATAAAPTELRVLTYDSLHSKGGWGEKIFPAFEKTCGCRLKISTAGDGAQILTRLELERARGKPGTDVVIGLDQNLWGTSKKYIEGWKDWRPEGFDKIPVSLRIGPDGEGFLPFDHGVFAFMWDSKKGDELKLKAPSHLADLLKPEFRRRLILQDPRTSTPGLSFVLLTRILKDPADFRLFWGALRGQWLTLAQGWDAAYGLFLRGEAPLVWSYTTSQAYHREHGDPSRYQALIFEDGNPVQIEGAAIVQGSAAPLALKRALLEFLISPSAQESLPKRQWMLPARADVPLPASFSELPKPKKRLGTHPVAPPATVLKEWEGAIRTSATSAP